MIKRGLLAICIVFVCFILCGCDREKPVMLFNNQPINTTTVQAPINVFELGETTHYVIFNPKGFDSPYLRLQIIKKNTKVQNWGYGLYRSQDIKIDKSKKFYIDSIKISQSGFYIVTVYYLSDLTRPIVRATFTVK